MRHKVYLFKLMQSTSMKVDGKNYRTIWINEENEEVITIIDQRYLPHRFITEDLHTVSEVAHAIKDMHVRGAGLIGATAGYGMYLATIEASHKNSFDHILESADALKATRPTAVNLEWAVNKQLNAIAQGKTAKEKIRLAREMAELIAQEDAEYCRRIGLHGVSIIEEISKRKKGKVVNILTHCNAGWLAFVDYGSATAPIYEAFERGINLHVWVDETRPRNQGASLTAWELMNQGIPHTVIVDNAGGHLMQHALVDMVITGADRVTLAGDAANKIGTYLKALAAHDNGIPFYVALPSSTFDWSIHDGVNDISIEERNPDEVKYIYGLCDGEIKKVLITPLNSPAGNYGFDVTPARLISGLITERGICRANEEDISKMYAEKVKQYE
jgi:methylthioribose-1-phosphate isomerase